MGHFPRLECHPTTLLAVTLAPADVRGRGSQGGRGRPCSSAWQRWGGTKWTAWTWTLSQSHLISFTPQKNPPPERIQKSTSWRGPIYTKVPCQLSPISGQVAGRHWSPSSASLTPFLGLNRRTRESLLLEDRCTSCGIAPSARGVFPRW